MYWQKEFPKVADYIITYRFETCTLQVWSPEELPDINPSAWDLFYPCRLPEEPVFPEFLSKVVVWTKWPPDEGNYWAKDIDDNIFPVIVEKYPNRFYNVYLADGFGKLSDIPDDSNNYNSYSTREASGQTVDKMIRNYRLLKKDN